MLKTGKLAHLIKELKQNNEKEQPKVVKKGETSGKEKVLAILMVQPWERVVRQRITQSFSPSPEILFPPLREDEGTEGPMIIEAEIGDHCVHPTTPLIGFSGEIIWRIGQIQLLVKIGDEEHTAFGMDAFSCCDDHCSLRTMKILEDQDQKIATLPHKLTKMLKNPVGRGVIP
ncbi:hypothetical protein Tco_0834043 [Tanacetum coccineum]